MGKLWNSLVDAVTRDDLFIRVTLAVFGFGSSWLGVLAISGAIDSDETWGWVLVLWVVGVLFLSWGVVVFVAAFTSPSSRWSKVAEKFYPDPAGLDDAAVFLVVVLIPAVALTLFLRALGVRGYAT